VNPVIRPRARDDIIRQFRWYLVDRDALRVVRILHGKRDIDGILQNEPADDGLLQ
jgi:plasmid stabilization system protein ParE